MDICILNNCYNETSIALHHANAWTGNKRSSCPGLFGFAPFPPGKTICISYGSSNIKFSRRPGEYIRQFFHSKEDKEYVRGPISEEPGRLYCCQLWDREIGKPGTGYFHEKSFFPEQ